MSLKVWTVNQLNTRSGQVMVYAASSMLGVLPGSTREDRVGKVVHEVDVGWPRWEETVVSWAERSWSRKAKAMGNSYIRSSIFISSPHLCCADRMQRKYE